MMKVETTKTVNVPATRAWEVIADFAHVDRCHPLVDHVDMRSKEESGVGAIRVCHFYDKTSLTEKVTDWQEGKGYTIQLSEFSMPLKEAAATLSVKDTGAGTSEVSFLMEFTPKFGPLGWVMGKLMMRPMMRKMFDLVLAGMAHHAVTGEEIGEGWKAPAGDSGVVAA
jgi:carbon monoxide dehydrogenase subunit G